MSVRRVSARSPARLKRADHAALWMLVEGAVADAFACHPDYLTDRGRRSAIESITKRVVGQIVGKIQETRKGGRFGASCAGGASDASRGSGRLGSEPARCSTTGADAGHGIVPGRAAPFCEEGAA